ncbi:MAG: hypothetical protein AAFX78_18645, partial [Cyanobacteria bacterium J06638_20]
MKLKQSDADLFFELMWALQFFVKQKKQLLPEIKTLQNYATLQNPDKKKLVRDAIFEQPELIDVFVQENPQKLSTEQLAIVQGWRHYVIDTFVIERVLKRYAVFIDGEDRVYGVLSLYDDLIDMIPKHALPFPVKTILLPFKGKIVYDGLLQGYNVMIGGNMTAGFKDTYLAAKQNQEIIESLDDLLQSSTTSRKSFAIKDWSEELAQLAQLAKALRGGAGQPPINSAAFSLIRASIKFAQVATSEEASFRQIEKCFDKVDRALGKAYSAANRMY